MSVEWNSLEVVLKRVSKNSHDFKAGERVRGDEEALQISILSSELNTTSLTQLKTEISYNKFVEEIQIQQKIPQKIVPNFLFNYKIKSTEIIHLQTCYRK